MAQTKYKVGDIVFFSTGNHTVAGEAMFIGQLKYSPDDLVLVIGKQIVEIAAERCMLTRGGFPAEGELATRLPQAKTRRTGLTEPVLGARSHPA